MNFLVCSSPAVSIYTGLLRRVPILPARIYTISNVVNNVPAGQQTGVDVTGMLQGKTVIFTKGCVDAIRSLLWIVTGSPEGEVLEKQLLCDRSSPLMATVLDGMLAALQVPSPPTPPHVFPQCTGGCSAGPHAPTPLLVIRGGMCCLSVAIISRRNPGVGHSRRPTPLRRPLSASP
jgi:hypothetical protein